MEKKKDVQLGHSPYDLSRRQKSRGSEKVVVLKSEKPNPYSVERERRKEMFSL